MITNPIALGIAIFFALITIAPKRAGFGDSFKDHLAVMAGALISAIFGIVAVS